MGQLIIPAIAAATSTEGLMLIGTGLTAAGQIQQGRVAEAEAKSAQNMANYNAAVMEQTAKTQELKTKFELGRQAEEARRIKGALRAKVGKAGGIGSPVFEELTGEQAMELDLDNLLIGYEGRRKAERARNQANLDVMQGKIYREQGKNARTASYIGAGTSLLTGFSGYGDYKKPKTTKTTGNPYFL